MAIMKLAWASILAIIVAAFLTVGAAQAAPPLEAYGELPSVEDMAISASGDKLAIVASIDGDRRFMVVEVGKDVITGYSLGDLKFVAVHWAGDEHAIVRLRGTMNLGLGFTTDKTEVSTAVVASIDPTGVKSVFSGLRSMANFTQGYHGTRFSKGKWKAYFGGLKYRVQAKTQYVFDHGRPHLFEVDLAKNDPDLIAPAAPEGSYRDWLIDGAGEVAATLTVSTKTGRWSIVNARRDEIASGEQPTGQVGLVSLGGDGTTAVYQVFDPGSTDYIYKEVSLAGGEPQEILADVDVDRFYIDPTNGQMLGYLPESSSQTVLFDPAKQAILHKVLRAFPGGSVRIDNWTPSMSHLLVHTSGNEDSGTWYLVDVAKLKADPIGYDRPLINPEDVGPISTIEYRAADGLEMDGILTLPPGREAKNLPVLMLPHGGPNSHDREQFDWWAQAFASRGYAIFQPNFRGSTNRDAAFMRAGYGEWGRKMQTDISDGLAELVRRGIADPKRVCIMGASYGGYAALAGVTLQQGLYRCAVAVAPVSDVKEMYRSDRSALNHTKMLTRSFHEELGDPAGYDEISPRRFADRANAPILLVHGRDDTRVLFKQSKIMADALDDAGKPYEFVVLKEEDHFLSRSATRMQMLEAAMAFVQKHNPAD